jgi:hypothetical protein
MSEEHPTKRVTSTTTLSDVRKRIAEGQEIIVDEKGQIHIPEQAAHIDPQKKTVVKPSRWF